MEANWGGWGWREPYQDITHPTCDRQLGQPNAALKYGPPTSQKTLERCRSHSPIEFRCHDGWPLELRCESCWLAVRLSKINTSKVSEQESGTAPERSDVEKGNPSPAHPKKAGRAGYRADPNAREEVGKAEGYALSWPAEEIPADFS